MAKIYLLYGVLHPEDFLHSYGVIHAVKFTEGHRVHKTTIVLKNSIVQIIKYIVMEYTLGSNFFKNMDSVGGASISRFIRPSRPP